jgi:nitroreductase
MDSAVFVEQLPDLAGEYERLIGAGFHNPDSGNIESWHFVSR